MTWAKVDDKLFGHPKWLATSTPGKALWVSALSWCAGQETDGQVPAHVLPLLGATKAAARALVASGLWEEAEGGWLFHDWAEFQPDAASLRAKRTAESDGGKQGAHVRWHEKKGITVPGCQFCFPPEADGVPHEPPYGGPMGGGEWGANAPGPDPARTRTSYSPKKAPAPSVTRDDDPHPQPEHQNVEALLAAAGLARHEVRDFKVDLKANGTRNTSSLINALHRDGKLPGRVAEWRAERDLAAEASARPAKPAQSPRVAAHADLVQQFAAQEAAAANVVPIRQHIEGA